MIRRITRIFADRERGEKVICYYYDKGQDVVSDN